MKGRRGEDRHTQTGKEKERETG
jgi:hypothetical protein